MPGTLERLRGLPANTLDEAFARFANLDTAIDDGDPRLIAFAAAQDPSVFLVMMTALARLGAGLRNPGCSDTAPDGAAFAAT